MTRTTVATTNDTISRCLSVRQPFCWAIIAGFKMVENRESTTRYRGRIALHASLSWGYREYDFPDDADPFYDTRILDAIGGPGGLKARNPIFIRGALIGSVVLSRVISPCERVVFTDNITWGPSRSL